LSDTGEKVGVSWDSTSDCEKAYEPVRREVLYNIVAEFGIPPKLGRLIKMCLNETCSNFCIG
jgi:hypothetical protein